MFSSEFLASPQFRFILLVVLAVSNAATVLVGRYTRSSVPTDELYVVNHVILITEISKLLLSCIFEYFATNGQLFQSIKTNIIDAPYDALKIMVPALLYLFQNSLLYVALSNLSAPIFQVTYQGKLVTTAIVSVLMLNRKYSLQQWVCLVTLSLGVAIVVLGEKDGNKKESTPGEQSLAIGLMAVTASCCSSAIAGVYFEKVVKGSPGSKQKTVSVWMRNIQLSIFSIVTARMRDMFTGSSTSTISEQPYFHGFTKWVWVMVALQAGGGLLVAAVIKYADNVLKGLATGVSVCLATAVSTVLFGTTLSSQFAIGAPMILVSVYFFSNPCCKKETSAAAESRSKPTDKLESGAQKKQEELPQ